jgi:hypothetical protein
MIMKKVILASAILLCSVLTNAQEFSWGAKAGLSSQEIVPENVSALILKGATDSLKLTLSEAGTGFHFGLYSRVKFSGFFIQPELIFNSANVSYKAKTLGLTSIETIKKESYQNIDIPIIFGLKGKFIRIGVGPVGHYHIASKSELLDFANYGEKFKAMTFGYQAGIGFDLQTFQIDVRYEGNFTNFGNQITYGGNSFSFSTVPARFILSLGYKFN